MLFPQQQCAGNGEETRQGKRKTDAEQGCKNRVEKNREGKLEEQPNDPKTTLGDLQIFPLCKHRTKRTAEIDLLIQEFFLISLSNGPKRNTSPELKGTARSLSKVEILCKVMIVDDTKQRRGGYFQ